MPLQIGHSLRTHCRANKNILLNYVRQWVMKQLMGESQMFAASATTAIAIAMHTRVTDDSRSASLRHQLNTNDHRLQRKPSHYYESSSAIQVGDFCSSFHCCNSTYVGRSTTCNASKLCQAVLAKSDNFKLT